MKFTIKGHEYEDYQLSNEQIVDLLDDERNVEELTESGREFLMKKVYERFKHDACARKGEGKDELFARQFSEYVNRCPNDFKKAAEKMGRDHRYLQNEMFKVCLEYFKVLEQAYLNDCYDERNKWAVRTASKALSLLRAEDWAI